MMEPFLSCLCDGELEALIINGESDQATLDEVWLIILSEYYELKGEIQDGSEAWKLTRDIRRIENHILLVEMGVSFLRERYSDSVAHSIRMLGYYFRPKVKEPDAYAKALNTILNQCKTKFIELEQHYEDLKIQISKIDNNRPTRQYFDKLLIQIEEMQGAVYNMESITVQKFVMLENKYWQKIDQADIENALKNT